MPRAGAVRVLLCLGLCGLVGTASVTSSGPAQARPTHAQIVGSGSGDDAPAVTNWIADVIGQGLQVVYSASGSAQGQQDFEAGYTDFAVTDYPFSGVKPASGPTDTSQGRGFAYVPVIAEGTTFPYQLRFGATVVRNLRLSGQTLAKIFTEKITNWDDPAITADNNGHAFPSLPVTPVVDAQASGATFQFTSYLASQFPALWHSAVTTTFPAHAGQVAVAGPAAVDTAVSAPTANGAIGYNPYAYPLAATMPVANVLNHAGYFTPPGSDNIAIALQHVLINTDPSSPNYGQQVLTNVYASPEADSYPLSSYSYLEIPTGSSDPRMTTPKRQTLADFLSYAVCGGQISAGPLGYAPLPPGLVLAAYTALSKLHLADPLVALTQPTPANCANPSYALLVGSSPTRLPQLPQPPACDQVGQGPCGDATTSPSSSSSPTTVPTSTSAHSPASGQTLAASGEAVGPDVELALCLIAVGSFLVMAATRRRRGRHRTH